ncbi:MAG: aldose 1-epimerase [Candidatus Poriferisodalaceae bacterium]|jgi:aldose 1-epimerase
MHFESARAQASVGVQGGRLAPLIIDGLEVLVTEGPKPTRWGSFPMIPWYGRLPHGVMEFGGQRWAFPLNSPPHANHGLSFLQVWSVAEPGLIRADLLDPWPFGGHVTQRFELDDNSLTLTLTLTATVHGSDRAMPAMIGWHPWFRRELDRGQTALLSFEAESVYLVDDEAIPTGELVAVPPAPWDHCFVGLSADPVITWPNALGAHPLELTVSSDMDHWVIFTEPEQALCIEPQSGPPNEFHIAPQVVRPGETMTHYMRLAWA